MPLTRKPQCQRRHAAHALQLAAVAEDRLGGGGEHVSGDQHATDVVAGLREGGGVVIARHEYDDVRTPAVERIMQSARNLISGSARIVVLARRGDGGPSAVGLACRGSDHTTMVPPEAARAVCSTMRIHGASGTDP